jgi:hypothetical protein
MDELKHTSDAIKDAFKKNRRCKLIIQRLSPKQVAQYIQKNEIMKSSPKGKGRPTGKNLL